MYANILESTLSKYQKRKYCTDSHSTEAATVGTNMHVYSSNYVRFFGKCYPCANHGAMQNILIFMAAYAAWFWINSYLCEVIESLDMSAGF